MEEEKKDIIEEEIDLSVEEEGDEEGRMERGPFPWLRVILIAAIIAETGLLVYTAMQRNLEGRELSSARQKLSSMEEELALNKDALETMQATMVKAKRDLELAQSEKSKLEIEVQEKDLEKLKLQLQQQELAQAKTDMENKLVREKQISEYLRRKIVDSKKNELVLMGKVEELIQSEKAVREELQAAQQEKEEQPLGLGGVPLKEVVVTDAGEPKIPLTGTILIANNEVEPPFVIINLGSADGVATGDRFAVKKGKKDMGSVIVSKLYRNMAVADIDKERTKKNLKKNLKVVSE